MQNGGIHSAPAGGHSPVAELWLCCKSPAGSSPSNAMPAEILGPALMENPLDLLSLFHSFSRD